MDIWSIWLDMIRSILMALSSDAGLGLGLAIIVATVLLRVALLPLAWPVAYRGCIRQKKMLKLQPKLKLLKERYIENPDVYIQKMMELYRKYDLTIVDVKSLIGAFVQLPIFLGMFQVLRSAGEGVRFLWVSDLLRSDVLFAFIAGVTTALMMAVNPEMPEQIRMFMIILPSVLAIIAAFQFSSALAIYWATSNVFSAAQTVLLHVIVRHRINSDAIRI